ncbi:MAG: hypothetical protein NXI03_05890 [Alphaproteobacteria bacterium]|uniref:hypothetical protein n=1 Tax=Maricaulis alexandrii TaxID=2570354 RepID=UPI001107E457|nr:hypothetical protein [Maricaulis alexandrii]MCR9267086.1 hypothetical protein [Alphaproteobacteria bacterium]
MIRLIAEGWVGVRASLRLLTFRPGWEDGFNTSIAGFWRSFAAILPAIPMVLLIQAATVKAGGTMSYLDQFVVQSLSWFIFPVAAAAACFATGARAAFVRWVVVHNWAVIWLYFYLFVVWMAYTAGVLPTFLTAIALNIYPYIRVLVHWRVAYATLGLPTITSALAAAAPILAIELAMMAYLGTLETPA